MKIDGEPALKTSRRKLIAGALGTAVSAAVPSRIAGSSASDVVIVGAGLSGLMAALLLEQEGLSVQVLESRRRVGGRLFTLDHVPGAPEAGGNVIGPMYARLLDLAQRLDIELEPMKPREIVEYGPEVADRAVLHLGGELIRLQDWEEHPANPFPEGFESTFPWAFRGAAFSSMNPLRALDDWQKTDFHRYDVSVKSALKSAGFDEPSVALGIAENQGYGNDPTDVSALHIYQLLTWGQHQGQGQGVFHVKGGNQRLPEAMGGSLQRSIIHDTQVVALRSTSSGVEILAANGDVYRGRSAIVTVPFSAARTLRFSPELPQPQKEAIETLAYSSTTQVLCNVTAPYWEQDGTPASMWTDTEIGQLLAYSYGDEGAIESACLWMMGNDALRADRYSDQELIENCWEVLERIRPAAARALTPIGVFSWQRESSTGGTWASWAPGQIKRFSSSISQPHGRIHFAGEHTAHLERGMEGALESGERAALEVLDRLL